MKHTRTILLLGATLITGASAYGNEREYLPEDWPAVERCQRALEDWEERQPLFPELSCDELVASGRATGQQVPEGRSHEESTDE